tara:strand:- start:10746 stop:11120 length:375 start_codon:yes stop_codon:yes gene_type:complete
MKIILSHEESEKFFFDALCNGLSELRGYGLQLTYRKKDYADAREKLTSPCYEDVLMQILRDGNKLRLVDHENGFKPRILTLDDVHTKVSNTEARWLIQMDNGEDDAVTADCILQSTFYGEVIFG